MSDLFQRLRGALPHVEAWIDRLNDQHYASAVPLEAKAFPRLPQYFPAVLLRHTRVVTIETLPFRPVKEYGIPEFAFMEGMGSVGITFRNLFFVTGAHTQNEVTHFHELVHVVQWASLGISDFLLTYGFGLAKYGYEQSPLEAIAYALQADFEATSPLPSLEPFISAHAYEVRSSAASELLMHGVKMGIQENSC